MNLFIVSIIIYFILTALMCSISKDIRGFRENLFNIECKIAQADFYNKNKEIAIRELKTSELVDKLSSREGVKKLVAEPYKDVNVKTNGSATILIITD